MVTFLESVNFERIMHLINLVVSLYLFWKFFKLIELAKKRIFLKNTVQLISFAFLLFFLLEIVDISELLPAFYSKIIRLAIELFFMVLVYMAILKMEKTILSQKYTVEEKKTGSKFE
ncbi:MAG: hypothetical protein QXW70_04090 [Candidatus Anstonellales archaeon]